MLFGVVVTRRADSTRVAEGGRGGLTVERRRREGVVGVWKGRKQRDVGLRGLVNFVKVKVRKNMLEVG